VRRPQSGQALVEWAAVSFVLLLFALGLLAVGQVIGEYMAVRSAATQAAFAAARAPNAGAAQQAGQASAREAIKGSQVEDFKLTIESAGFQRGGTLTATADGYVSLAAYPIVAQVLGRRIELKWQAHALIEPYRSRTP
jgi:Flp pilus assembly protein TadG